MQVNKRGAVVHAEVWDMVHPKQFLVGAAPPKRLLLRCLRSACKPLRQLRLAYRVDSSYGVQGICALLLQALAKL